MKRWTALCQDCAAVHVYESERERAEAHLGERRCPCGGDLCACSDCVIVAAKIGRPSHSPDLLDSEAMARSLEKSDQFRAEIDERMGRNGRKTDGRIV